MNAKNNYLEGVAHPQPQIHVKIFSRLNAFSNGLQLRLRRYE